jgi:hypothetical protein
MRAITVGLGYSLADETAGLTWADVGAQELQPGELLAEAPSVRDDGYQPSFCGNAPWKPHRFYRSQESTHKGHVPRYAARSLQWSARNPRPSTRPA